MKKVKKAYISVSRKRARELERESEPGQAGSADPAFLGETDARARTASAMQKSAGLRATTPLVARESEKEEEGKAGNESTYRTARAIAEG